MDDNYSAAGPCVCGFGDEFFTMEGDHPICTVCGGIVGKSLQEFVDTTVPIEAKTILIVDDQAFFRERIRQILKEKGHNVLESADGLGGIKVIAEVYLNRREKLPKKIDALVLDLVMPGELDGILTLAVVKTIISELPVLVLTAKPPEKDLLQKLAKLGAKKYLNKAASDLDDLILKNIQEL